MTLPFFDDFSNYTGYPDGRHWQDSMAIINVGYAPLPPTVGMATFDALDADGNLYESASTSTFPADTLTSRPIHLDGLQPSDSVVLSFYYLPGGGSGNRWERVGETPDPNDSLFLDFFFAHDSVWRTVWGCSGVSVDTLVARTGLAWQYVAVAVADSACFDSTFRFRFRTYCSLETNGKTGMTGNSDQWNIDYVLLDRNRSVAGTPAFRDVAFVEPAPSLLKRYQAMPARQYATADMADTLEMTITNLFSSTLTSQYTYAVVDASSDTLYRYPGGFQNIPPFLPDGQYQSAPAHARPAVGYSFPESNTPSSYTIVHIVREGMGGDSRQQNDTVRFQQIFSNYYAYDDGTSESGYGLTSTASHVYLANRYDLRVPDTLTAVDMYFNRTYHGENERIPFFITIWDNDNGHPGNILYQDQTRRLPAFDGLNRYHRYPLENEVIVEGTIFVGFDQGNNDFINLGFDCNNNSAESRFYLTDVEWQQSILSGSLMLRPCFGSAALLGIEHPQLTALNAPLVYPNPANQLVHIDGIPAQARIELYDMLGRRPLSTFLSPISTLDVSNLPSGVYMLRIIDTQAVKQSGNQAIHNVKLIISH